MKDMLLDEVYGQYKSIDITYVNDLLNKELQRSKKKIVVLDDDPTGIQTVHDISVYTDWSMDSIRSGLCEENKMFFILTNSRGLTADETKKVHKKIALNLIQASKELNKEFIIISRGDSTLRGHYPLETQVLKEIIEENSVSKIHGEVIFPFFKAGGRYTANNIHYVAEGNSLTPVGESEFAKDKTFGYSSSHLGEWIEEKSERMYKKEDVIYISIENLRSMELDKIVSQLLEVNNFNKIVVNALDDIDVKIFCIALHRAMLKGKNFIFRTAADFTKVMGGISDKTLLLREDLIKTEEHNGGLVMVGSHTKKTNEQVEELKNLKNVVFIEFNNQLIFNKLLLDKEIETIVKSCEELIFKGTTVIVCTGRETIALNSFDKEEELKASLEISKAITSIVKKLKVKPNFIIAKGGITSSDIGVNGLSVKKALVLGQIKPGIPVWKLGNESKFPSIPYVIFPGNVGGKTTLKEIVEILL